MGLEGAGGGALLTKAARIIQAKLAVSLIFQLWLNVSALAENLTALSSCNILQVFCGRLNQ